MYFIENIFNLQYLTKQYHFIKHKSKKMFTFLLNNVIHLMAILPLDNIITRYSKLFKD